MILHFSAKKVECAETQCIHLVGDQPKCKLLKTLWSTNGGVPLGLE